MVTASAPSLGQSILGDPFSTGSCEASKPEKQSHSSQQEAKPTSLRLGRVPPCPHLKKKKNKNTQALVT